MKPSLLLAGFFGIGVLLGRIAALPAWLIRSETTMIALYALLFLVGVGIGGSTNRLRALRSVNWRLLLIPLGTVVGTLIGVAGASVFLRSLSLREALAVGSGFGYYSLSSVLISQIHGETLGVLALLSNLSREMITLLFTPLLASWFGRLAPVMSGGATAMDTTLPGVTVHCGKEYALFAVFNGFCLTLLVPVIVPLILS